MNIPLFPEQVHQVSAKIKILAQLALFISAPLNWLSPGTIEKILFRLLKRYPPATKDEILAIRNAICSVSKRCQSQDGCLRRSIAVSIALCIKRKSSTWCTGYAQEPFRAHAWVELHGEPVGEPDDISLYTKVISIPSTEDTLQVKKINSKEIDAVQKTSEQEENEINGSTPRVTIRQLFSLAKGHNKEFISVLILGIMSAILTLVQPDLVAKIIEQSGKGFTINASLVILIIVLFISMILTTIQYYLLQKIGEGVVYTARSNLISHLLKLPIFEYNKRSIGDLLSRVSGDSSKLRMALIQGTIAFSGGIFIVIGAAIGMIARDFLLFMTTLITVCFAFIGIIFMSSIIQKSSFRVQKELGKLSSLMERDLQAIRTIRATNSTLTEEKRAILQAGNLRDLGIRLAKIQSLMTPISNMSLQVCGLIVLGLGGYRVSMGYMNVSDLIAYALLLYTMIGPVGQIFGAFSGMGDSLGAFARIKELLELALEPDYDIKPVTVLSSPALEKDVSIHFENVSFGYNKMAFGTDFNQKEDAMILKKITLSARQGQRTAIVGPSGAGKSTILQLIERFYDVDSGQIYIEGKDYLTYSREELRNLITYVEQNAPVITGTLRENLLLGNPDATDKECYDVLDTVNLSHLLGRSSKNLDMEIGESGTKLSGGERQRLAIARSLLSSAQIVILDELTSNLDSLNEIEIKKAVDNMRGIKTVIIVAHRLSTIVDSDIIYVLEHGRIVGSGNHNNLLDTVPLYRELAKEQFLDKLI